MTGAEFRAALAALHLRQSWLAERLGIDATTVNRWATGKAPVAPYVVYVLELLRERRGVGDGGVVLAVENIVAGNWWDDARFLGRCAEAADRKGWTLAELCRRSWLAADYLDHSPLPPLGRDVTSITKLALAAEVNPIWLIEGGLTTCVPRAAMTGHD